MAPTKIQNTPRELFKLKRPDAFSELFGGRSAVVWCMRIKGNVAYNLPQPSTLNRMPKCNI
jgi:hypothetical protein